MDVLDKKILQELMLNARLPITQLAKRVRASREVTNYRIKNLLEKKIIKAFVTEIDISALGFIGAAVFLSIKKEQEKKFLNKLQTCGYVSWVAELAGIWNYGLSVYGRNQEEVDNRIKQLFALFDEAIIDSKFLVHKQTRFFYEKYLGQQQFKEKKKNKHKIDNKDKIILKELCLNARKDSVALAKKTNLSAPAVSKRIKKLEHSEIIKRYSLFIDLKQLNLQQYSVFIRNKHIAVFNKQLAFLEAHPSVSFIADYVGLTDYEIGIVVTNPYELRTILREIEEAFPDNRILEVSLFQKEFLSVGPPRCVFGEEKYYVQD